MNPNPNPDPNPNPNPDPNPNPSPEPDANADPNPKPNPKPNPNPNPNQVHCERAECTEAVWASQASNVYGTCGAQIEWVQANIAGMGELTAACTYVGQQASTSS